MEKVINLTDIHDIKDNLESQIIYKKLSGAPKKTSIVITDHDSGEILGEYHNKIVITGATFAAERLWGLESPIKIPSYNTELGLENTVDYKDKSNLPVICLFCIGDSGCGAKEEDVFTASYIDRIAPENDIIPFRYVDADKDLNTDLRKYYFGRKIMGDKIGYYFKAFDTVPQIHLKYTDGTDITEDIYKTQTVQDAECYVETRLRITRTDFRDYFEQVLGWKKARISTLSLCSAWYTEKDGYKWYQDIYPYSKLNFSFEKLVDLTKAVDFQYSVFY